MILWCELRWWHALDAHGTDDSHFYEGRCSRLGTWR
jgi:hypothetical protein